MRPRRCTSGCTARGEAENRIKEAQFDLFGRRASSRRFAANQLSVGPSGGRTHLAVAIVVGTVLHATRISPELSRPSPKPFQYGANSIKLVCAHGKSSRANLASIRRDSLPT